MPLGLGADRAGFSEGMGIEVRELDVTDDEAVRELFAGLDRLDILVPAAGVTLGEAESTPEGFRKVS